MKIIMGEADVGSPRAALKALAAWARYYADYADYADAGVTAVASHAAPVLMLPVVSPPTSMRSPRAALKALAEACKECGWDATAEVYDRLADMAEGVRKEVDEDHLAGGEE